MPYVKKMNSEHMDYHFRESFDITRIHIIYLNVHLFIFKDLRFAQLNYSLNLEFIIFKMKNECKKTFFV